jgi:hypothetical protein
MTLRFAGLLVCLLCSALVALVAAEGPDSRVSIPLSTKEPSMSGTLMDGWETAALVNDFSNWLPSDVGEVRARTEARIVWTNTALFVAVHAFDADPGAIRAFPTLRDKITKTLQDCIVLEVDPSGSGASAIRMVSNIYGAKTDGKTINAGPASDDNSFDLDWSSSGGVVADGYIVKFKLPLNSVQGRPGDWKIRITRYYPRDANYALVWPRQYSNTLGGNLCNMAFITPPPQVNMAAPFYFTPFVTYSSEKTTSGADNSISRTHESQVGFDMRYATGGSSFEGTYRPDFSAIEADVDPLVVNSRFNVALAEKRPFFMNGMDVLSPRSAEAQFYSRSLIQPKWAVKGNGEQGWGRWVALAGEDTYGGGAFNLDWVNRPTRDSAMAVALNTDNAGSSVTVVGTDRRVIGEDARNTTGGLYLDQKMGKFEVAVSCMKSNDRINGKTLSGYSDSAEILYNSNNQGIVIYHYGVSPDAQMRMGFLDLNGYNVDGGSYVYHWSNKNPDGFIKAFQVKPVYSAYKAWDGVKFMEYATLNGKLNIRGGLEFSFFVDAYGAEWIGLEKFKSQNRSATLTYTGAKGLSISGTLVKADVPDYVTSKQARETIKQLVATYNFKALTLIVNMKTDELHDAESGELNLDAHRYFAALNLAMPWDFYVRETWQNVDEFRPILSGFRKTTSYGQAILGWQPTAFTNCYLGYTQNRVRDFSVPFEGVGERFFGKMSYSIRW